MTTREHHPTLAQALRGQPKQVWITAFAAVIAFMGIGLVDPILLSIAQGLHASPSQVTMLFTSYLGVQVVAMLVTGWCTARFGAKRTVVAGLAIIVVATVLCASANSIGVLIGLRGLWGLGNALFIATALSVIVGAASGGHKGAILLYEAALGLGLSVGPLLGALLGNISWRGPFAGTAVLMAIGMLLCIRYLSPDTHAPRESVSVLDPLRALRHGGLLRTSIGSALYTAAFFAVLAWTPFVLEFSAVKIGLIFFAWGLCVAVAGVLLAPRFAARFGERHGLIIAVIGYAALMALLVVPSKPLTVIVVIVSGLVSGLLNTLFTGTAMSVSPAARPIASAGYNFCRWLGGAVAAVLVSHVASWFDSTHFPFVFAAAFCVIAAGVLTINPRRKPDAHTVPAEAVLVGNAEF